MGRSSSGELRGIFGSLFFLLFIIWNSYPKSDSFICLIKNQHMNFLETFSSWAKKLTDVGVSIIALGVVLEVLFKGAAIPFWPEVSVVDNIMGIIGNLSNEGLLGLVGAVVLYHVLKNKEL